MLRMIGSSMLHEVTVVSMYATGVCACLLAVQRPHSHLVDSTLQPAINILLAKVLPAIKSAAQLAILTSTRWAGWAAGLRRAADVARLPAAHVRVSSFRKTLLARQGIHEHEQPLPLCKNG
jgi:hypothetical protein